MLVQKKQDWLYEENAPLTIPEPKPKPQPQPQQPKIKKKAKINKSLRSKCLTLGLTITTLAIIATMQSAYIVKSGYAIVETKQQILKTESSNEILRLEIANLKAPDRIENIAARQLGMVTPQNAYFSSGTSTYPDGGVPKPPAQNTAPGVFDFVKQGQ